MAEVEDEDYVSLSPQPTADDDNDVRAALLHVLNSMADACASAWASVWETYDFHTRREEYRQIQSENDIAASVAELRDVKAFVHSRLIELRAEAESHAKKVLKSMHDSCLRDARVHFGLKLLYDRQYLHTQETMSAIEAHIVSLEAMAVNRRVVRALRKGAAAATGGGDESELHADQAIDELAEQHETTQRIIDLLAQTSSNVAVDEDIDEQLHAWLSTQTSPPAPSPATSSALQEEPVRALQALPYPPQSSSSGGSKSTPSSASPDCQAQALLTA